MSAQPSRYTPAKALAFLLFLLLFVVSLLYFVGRISFNDTIVLLVADIGAWFTVSVLIS